MTSYIHHKIVNILARFHSGDINIHGHYNTLRHALTPALTRQFITSIYRFEQATGQNILLPNGKVPVKSDHPIKDLIDQVGQQVVIEEQRLQSLISRIKPTNRSYCC